MILVGDRIRSKVSGIVYTVLDTKIQNGEVFVKIRNYLADDSIGWWSLERFEKTSEGIFIVPNSIRDEILEDLSLKEKVIIQDNQIKSLKATIKEISKTSNNRKKEILNLRKQLKKTKETHVPKYMIIKYQKIINAILSRFNVVQFIISNKKIEYNPDSYIAEYNDSEVRITRTTKSENSHNE